MHYFKRKLVLKSPNFPTDNNVFSQAFYFSKVKILKILNFDIFLGAIVVCSRQNESPKCGQRFLGPKSNIESVHGGKFVFKQFEFSRPFLTSCNLIFKGARRLV
jgi:hypothetical protein